MRVFLLFAFILPCTGAFAQPAKYESSQWKQLSAGIGDRTVVALGEMGHGYETLNTAKAMTFDFLRTRMDFGAIIFESSFTQSMISYLKRSPFDDRLKGFLYPFWNTGSVRNALRPAYDGEQQTQEQLPAILGFDVQEDCRFTSFSSYLYTQGYARISKMLLRDCDSLLSLYIGKNPKRKVPVSKEEYDLLVMSYNVVSKELDKGYMQDVTRKIIMRCIENRKWLCEYLTISDTYERMHFRDSIMASNVIWIKEELLPSKKIVLWSADTHIAKPGKTKLNFMGERLSDYFKKDYYAISYRRVMGLPTGRFDSIFNVKKLEKIKSKEWITPCD